MNILIIILLSLVIVFVVVDLMTHKNSAYVPTHNLYRVFKSDNDFYYLQNNTRYYLVDIYRSVLEFDPKLVKLNPLIIISSIIRIDTDNNRIIFDPKLKISNVKYKFIYQEEIPISNEELYLNLLQRLSSDEKFVNELLSYLNFVKRRVK